MTRSILFQLIAVAILGPGHAVAAPDFSNWPYVSGPYIGQKPPGMAAELFAPNLISTDQSETGWGKEEYLGPVVNSGKSQVYPTVASNGTLYFQAVREEGYGKADIYRSRLVDGVYQVPENLGPIVNSKH